MKLSKLLISFYLLILSAKAFSETSPKQVCYRVSNPSALAFSLLDSDSIEIVKSAFVVAEGVDLRPSIPMTPEILKSTTLTLHARSQNLYFKSNGFLYSKDDNKYIGESDSGSMEIKFPKNNAHLSLLSEGISGYSPVNSDFSDAKLSFKKGLSLVKLTDSACKEKIKNLPKLPVEG